MNMIMWIIDMHVKGLWSNLIRASLYIFSEKYLVGHNPKLKVFEHIYKNKI